MISDTKQGYTLGALVERQNGLVAQLSLDGAPCNKFGHDQMNLTIEVTYETENRYV